MIDSRGQRATFTGLLLTAMVAGTIAIVSFGILSRFLIEDLDISRAQVGALVTAAALAAAIASPPSGRLTDRIGGRRALFALFSLSTVGLLSIAAAPTYALLLLGAAIAGVAQAFANPATNKLIAHHIRAGRRGLITGIKQSGVQVGLFLGGLLLPAGALALGWRATLALVAIVPALGWAATRLVLPTEDADEDLAASARRSRLPQAVWWLTAYSLAMGLGAGALLTFLPLYLQEEFGMTVTEAGFAVAVFGLVALMMRIIAASIAERVGSFERMLGSFAAAAAVAVLLLLIANTAGNVALWAGVLLGGASVTPWNSVAMLAVINHAGPTLAGRSTAMVFVGFIGGFGIGPLIFGYSVDSSGSYTPGLLGIVVLCVGAAALTVVWQAWNRRLTPAADSS